MNEGYHSAVRRSSGCWKRPKEVSQLVLGAGRAPSVRATGPPAGCRSAPFCSLCSARQSAPASATLPGPRNLLVDRGRPFATCRRRFQHRAPECRRTVRKRHGGWRSGRFTPPGRFPQPDGLGTKGPQRAVRGAGRRHWGVADPPSISFVTQRFQRCDGDSARGTASSEPSP